MRIDLPRCNFKNCKYCFDSNCTKKNEYERCEYRQQKAEIDELRKSEEIAKQNAVNMARAMPNIAKATRIEAIKEFAERLKRDITINNTEDGCLIYSIDYGCLMEDIDNLVEEMTEEKK